MEGLKRLIREIHRRSIWQVMSVYALGGWFAFQIVQSMTEGLGLPSWFPGLAVVLLIIGVPIVLATAIVQEGISGPEPEPASAVSATPPPTTVDRLFTWKNAIGGGILAFALWGVIAAGWMLFGAGVIGRTDAGLAGEDARRTIAVLPFTSVRSDEDSESFRVGLHDELLTQLVKVGGLRVTSRTSVLEYEKTTKNIRQIGTELGVGALVEGSVQREGDTVKVNVQLIDAGTDEHLWAETYTRRLSAANIISMQAEVVRDIARALRAALSPAEEQRLADVPTDNLEAYDFYLRGRAREATRVDEDLLLAEEMYRRAIQLDPGFALAHVRLGIVHNALHWFGVDRAPERLDAALTSIQRAFALQPDLPEGHLALGRYYYQGLRDYDRALHELERAEAGNAPAAEIYTVRAAIERRTGRLDEAVVSWTRALETDPRSAGLAWDIANTLTALRRYEDAERYYDRALEIAPGQWTQYWRKAWNHLAWRGDLDAARRTLEQGDRNVRSEAPNERRASWYELELLARDPQAALRHAAEIGEAWVATQVTGTPGNSLSGEAYWRSGQTSLAQQHFRSARTELETWLETQPDDPFAHSSLAWAHARTGDAEEAVRLARRSVELLPPSVDAWLAPDLLRDLAAVYAVTGRHDEAIDVLEQLLAMPARAMSRPILRLDPVWDPLREHPRFVALVRDA